MLSRLAIMKTLCKYVWLFFFTLILSLPIHAKEVAEVINLLGVLKKKSASGEVVEMKKKDKVSVGDVLITGDGAYVQLKFIDKGEMIMRPGTEVTIADYGFDESNPKADKANLEIAKGGLRRLTGLIGKRGDKSADQLKTPTATVGIRGTVYETVVVLPNATQLDSNLAPGEYFKTHSGSIAVTTPLGTIEIPAGKFGTIKRDKADLNKTEAPVVLDKDPGLPPFNPPKDAQIGGGECEASLNINNFFLHNVTQVTMHTLYPQGR